DSLEERFHRRDQHAFTEIFERYSGPMFATALSMLGHRELAADAVQEAFIKIWQAADTYDTTRDLQPWLFTITRRTAIDIYRKTRTTPLTLDALGDTGLTTPPPSLERTWLIWQVNKALHKLHHLEREILHLAYYQQMTQTEISHTLNIPIGTVKSRTFRAQRHLAELLHPHLDHP
ncbi:RNA polymerase sigma factor, partial [Streptosporangium sp. OZ121]|uniref:RNA polymerase sigma factor n=1 Tax=Streptosporangium sp. OZ121 TaxID=3444183 RepID=UPI003F78E6F9